LKEKQLGIPNDGKEINETKNWNSKYNLRRCSLLAQGVRQQTTKYRPGDLLDGKGIRKTAPQRAPVGARG